MSTQDPIQITDKAAKRVAFLLDQETDSTQYFRVYVVGGGCSGLQYGFKFDRNLQDDDTVLEKTVADHSDIQLVIDFNSLEVLSGATVDYVTDLQGARFMLQIPNAEGTCSCGTSFTV